MYAKHSLNTCNVINVRSTCLHYVRSSRTFLHYIIFHQCALMHHCMYGRPVCTYVCNVCVQCMQIHAFINRIHTCISTYTAFIHTYTLHSYIHTHCIHTYPLHSYIHTAYFGPCAYNEGLFAHIHDILSCIQPTSGTIHIAFGPEFVSALIPCAYVYTCRCVCVREREREIICAYEFLSVYPYIETRNSVYERSLPAYVCVVACKYV